MHDNLKLNPPRRWAVTETFKTIVQNRRNDVRRAFILDVLRVD